MLRSSATTWYHSNRYNAQAACEHCSGVIRHESWCITVNPVVYYAYEAVLDASKLSVGDVLALHSLGVLWHRQSLSWKLQTVSIDPAPHDPAYS